MFFFIIPVSVEYKARRMPAVTFSLMGINTAVHLVMMILFFANETANERAYELFALIPNESTWYTYLTYNFLHADIFHLLGNMMYLFLFGSCVEDILGRGKFIAFYLLTGIVAGCAHVFVAHPSIIPMVGASGAISGCLGAFVLLLHNRQIEFKYVFLFFFRLFTRGLLHARVAGDLLLVQLGCAGRRFGFRRGWRRRGIRSARWRISGGHGRRARIEEVVEGRGPARTGGRQGEGGGVNLDGDDPARCPDHGSRLPAAIRPLLAG